MRLAAVLLGVLLIIFAISPSPRAAAETFGSNVRVNQPALGERNVPALAVGWDGTVYAAWQDKSSGHWRIMFAHQPASGGPFTGHVQVASSPPASSIEMTPDIGYWNQTVYVVWEDNRNTLSYDIYFSSIPVPGGVPSPEKRINDESWSGSREAPALAVGPNGTIYVAYDNESSQVKLVASYDGGLSWTDSVVVSWSAVNSRGEQRVAVDRHGKVYVVWSDGRSGMIDRPGGVQVEDDDVYIANSSDGGLTFGQDAPVNDVVRGKVQSSPAIAIDGNGRVHVAWKDERLESNTATDIFYANSDDGRDFGRNIAVNDTVRVALNPYKTTHQQPSVAVSRLGDTVFIAWADDRALNHSIYLVKSTDGGVTFHPGNIPQSGANAFFDDASSFNGEWDLGEATLLDNGNGVLDAGVLDGSPDKVIDAGKANLRTDLTGNRLRYHDQDSNGAWSASEDIVDEGPNGSFPHIYANILAPWDNSGYAESLISLLETADGLGMNIAPGRLLAVGGFNTANQGLQVTDPISDASLEIVYKANATYAGSASVNWAVDGGTNHSWFVPASTADIWTFRSIDLFAQGVGNVSSLQNLTVSLANTGLTGSVSFDRMILTATIGIAGVFDGLDTIVYNGTSPTNLGDSLANFSASDKIAYMDVGMAGQYQLGDPVIHCAAPIVTGGDLTSQDEVLSRADAPAWRALFDFLPLNDDTTGAAHYMPRIVLNPFDYVTAAWQDFRGGTPVIYSTTAPTDVTHGPYMAFWMDANKTKAGPGGLVQYKLHVRNIGGVAAANVTIANTLAPGLEFMTSNPSPNSTAGGVYTWNLGFVSSLGLDDIAVVASVNPSVPLRTILPSRAILNFTDILGAERRGQYSWLDIMASDLMPPVITHSPPGEVQAGSDLTISATVTDDTSVWQVRLYLKPVGASYFNSPILMNRVGSTDEYKVTFGPGDTAGTLGYYIEAYDTFGNVARSPAGAPADAYKVNVVSFPMILVIMVIAVIIAVVVIAVLIARMKKEAPPQTPEDEGTDEVAKPPTR